MGVYVYHLNKSKTWTLPGGAKLYNLKYSHRASSEDHNKWRWDDQEGIRYSNLCRARNQRSLDNTFPTEYVLFAIGLEDMEAGEIFKVYRGKSDNRHLRVWYDCNVIEGEWVGTVDVISLKPRRKLRYLPRPVEETEETYICEECNEEKPWSNGSDSSPECDDCWAKQEENTHG